MKLILILFVVLLVTAMYFGNYHWNAHSNLISGESMDNLIELNPCNQADRLRL